MPESSVAPKVSYFYDPRVRSALYQIVLCAAIALFFYAAARNVIDNLTRNRITSGFGFLNSAAGFDISQTLIEYSIQTSTYGRAFWVGLLNTLLVSALGIFFATLLGFVIGVARLSSNWLVSRLAASYVEIIRNLPLLLQLLFWYNAVLKALPEARQSLQLPFGTLLNNRGVFLPKPTIEAGGEAVLIALAMGVAGALLLRLFARWRLDRTGMETPTFWLSVALVVGLPAVAMLASGFHVTFAIPELGRFNVRGGVEILPEFAALLFGLTIYTAAFIAEVVRAGLMAVPRGQLEAAAAVGLRPGQVLKLVVIPQAKRVIIPPLTNQYLNLTKNSSLAVAIGYPDFVQIFTGTVLNQTGQAVEVVALTLAVYLVLSLLTSAAMNLYQARIAVAGR